MQKNTIFKDFSNEDFANWVKKTRERLGCNQANISKRIGITQGFWSKIERGKQRPSLMCLLAILKLVNKKKYYELQHYIRGNAK